jgi:hypothetical protein
LKGRLSRASVVRFVRPRSSVSSTGQEFTETMRKIVRWKEFLREHSDIICQVYTTADILKAKSENKTGIILGWMSITGIEDQIGYSEILAIRNIVLKYLSREFFTRVDSPVLAAGLDSSRALGERSDRCKCSSYAPDFDVCTNYWYILSS